MSLFSIKIKEVEFKVALVSDPAKMKEGLSGKPALGKNKGLLFDFEKEQTVTMNMQGMNYPLDMLFIDTSRKVVAVRTLLPGNFQTTVKNVRFVLEVNKGEGEDLLGENIECTAELAAAVNMAQCKPKEEHAEVKESTKKGIPKSKGSNIIVKVTAVPESEKQVFKKGGSFKIYEDQVKASAHAMQVLDDTGKVLMNIVGGERIFSIIHTQELVSLSKKVDKGEASEEELGALMQKIIHKQNTQKPEYV